MYECGYTSYTADFMRLWMKADQHNKNKLKLIYPVECQAMKEWEMANNPYTFYAVYKIEEIMLEPERTQYLERRLSVSGV